MWNQDWADYAKIVGAVNEKEYLGPEQQGEQLRRCTILENIETVSYTHLDVYKRQAYGTPARVYPPDSLIAEKGCEGGHDCFLCAMDCRCLLYTSRCV